MIGNTLFQSLFFLSPIVSAFNHPGLLVSEADISRIQKKLDAQQEPWLSSWNDLISLEYSNASYTNNAVATIYRGSDGTNSENNELLWHDAAAAFNLALRWKVTGDAQYAEAAANILTAWGKTLTSIGGNDDAYLAAGLQGYELANAAELLRDYSPFMTGGFSTFTGMMTSVFLPMNLDFLNHVLGSEHNVKHFFANWELCNMASVMAIGVVTENQTAFDYAVNYFKNGTGNGAIGNAITNIVEEPSTGNPLGQGQEAGRDQGHAGLDFQLLGAFAQQAYNQGLDLYSYDNNRILLGAEYYARYNLGNDVPFEAYTNGIVSYTEVSSASRGAYRPTWELLYNHYGVLKGLDAPWTEAYRNYTLEQFGDGYEGGAGSWGEGSGHYDGLGWGTLLYRLDESDIAAAKSPSAVSSSVVASSSVAPTPTPTPTPSVTALITPTTLRTAAIDVTATVSSSSYASEATPTASTDVDPQEDQDVCVPDY